MQDASAATVAAEGNSSISLLEGGLRGRAARRASHLIVLVACQGGSARDVPGSQIIRQHGVADRYGRCAPVGVAGGDAVAGVVGDDGALHVYGDIRRAAQHVQPSCAVEAEGAVADRGDDGSATGAVDAHGAVDVVVHVRAFEGNFHRTAGGFDGNASAVVVNGCFLNFDQRRAGGARGDEDGIGV